MLAADAVKAYKRSHQSSQSQNSTNASAAAAAINNTDRSSDRIIKSVVRIHCIYYYQKNLYSASSQGPQMRYVGRDGSMVT